MQFVRVAEDGRGFVTANSREPFVPWGFNYDRDYRSRLLEDYWDSEWETVAADFHEMKRLGANVVRIHLQVARFMDGPNQPNEHSLQQLDRLVKLAESNRLYIDVTGLGCYRKAEVPAWYSALGEKERWAAQARFWSAIARHCAQSPAILCYDLMNEPVVPAAKRAPGDWLAGELAGFSYVQFITLDPAGRPRTDIAHQWISALSSAIRKADTRHLITIGLLPISGADGDGFVPSRLASRLDYISVHIYPTHGKLAEDLGNLRRFQAGKPLVIEETYPLACSPAELHEFIEDSKPYASGWISFYWGQSPEQLRSSTNSSDVLLRDWLKVFERGKPYQ